MDRLIKTNEKVVSLILVLFLLCSCNKEEETVVGTYSTDYGLYIIDDSDDVNVNADDVTAEFNAVEMQIGKKLGDNAVSMLLDYGEDKKNIVVSPLNATILYSMMANFTDERKANTFHQGMGIDGFSIGDVNSYCQKVIYKNEHAKDSQNENSLTIENCIWIRANESVYKSFMDMTKSYDVNVKGISFSSGSETEQMKSALMSKMSNDYSGLNRNTWDGVKSVITSSMTLKKEWSEKMNVIQGTEYEFENADGSISNYTMLKKQRKANYADFESFSILEIPCSDIDYSMFVVYPHSTDLLNKSLQEIQQMGMGQCISLMREKVVDIEIPKFKYEGVTELNSQKNTVTKIQKMYQVNMPKVSPKGFSLDNIYQACSIELTETGTYVKAQSTVPGTTITSQPYIGSTPGGSSPSVEVLSFHVNHPFAIFIRSSKTGSIPYACCMKKLP